MKPATADGQLGVLGPDGGQRRFTVAGVEDKFEALQGHVAADQVEQRPRGLAADQRIAGQPQGGHDSGIGLDGQVAVE